MIQDRTLRTRAKLLDAAIELFETQGYEATTTQQIAAAAGVTQMTFFRHFPTKESVLVSDPYDPLIADLVAAQPAELPLLRRIHDGFLAALAAIDAAESETARRRIAIAGQAPGLRAALIASNHDTEVAVTDALVVGGADPVRARIAASAALAALSTALMAWAVDESGCSLAETVATALTVLVGDDAGRPAEVPGKAGDDE